MKAIHHFTAALIIMILVACTIVDGGSIVTGIKRGPISVDEVRIYRVAPDTYEEIAIVSASAGHDFKSVITYFFGLP